MQREAFDDSIDELSATVVAAMDAHFKSRRLRFDLRRFLQESNFPIEQFIKEAHFFGAEAFPVDIPVKQKKRPVQRA